MAVSAAELWLHAWLGACTGGVARILHMGCSPQLESSGPDPSFNLDDPSAVVTSVLPWSSAGTVCDTCAWQNTPCSPPASAERSVLAWNISAGLGRVWSSAPGVHPCGDGDGKGEACISKCSICGINMQICLSMGKN